MSLPWGGEATEEERKGRNRKGRREKWIGREEDGKVKVERKREGKGMGKVREEMEGERKGKNREGRRRKWNQEGI